MTPSLDKLGTIYKYDDVQDILRQLLQHCAYRRIEQELAPEKQSAFDEHQQVLRDNAQKQALIDNMKATSGELDLNDDQLDKLLKQRQEQM